MPKWKKSTSFQGRLRRRSRPSTTASKSPARFVHQVCFREVLPGVKTFADRSACRKKYSQSRSLISHGLEKCWVCWTSFFAKSYRFFESSIIQRFLQVPMVISIELPLWITSPPTTRSDSLTAPQTRMHVGLTGSEWRRIWGWYVCSSQW